MDKNDALTSQFFENLGKLFYAVAASDKKVEAIEINTLKEILKSQWLTLDFVDFDNLKQVVLAFDELLKEHQSTEALYQNFVIYKNKEKHLFTSTIKRLILQTTNAISSSFSGRNKSELIMLARLDLEFKKNAS